MVQKVKTPLGMPIYHISECWLEAQLLYFQSSFLLIMYLRRQWVTDQALGPHHSHGRPRMSSEILALSWPSHGCCGLLGSKTVHKNLFLSLLLSFQINEYIFTKPFNIDMIDLLLIVRLSIVINISVC